MLGINMENEFSYFIQVPRIIVNDPNAAVSFKRRAGRLLRLGNS